MPADSAPASDSFVVDGRQALADYVFTAKYARFRSDLGRRETYDEAIDRVLAMHEKKYAGQGTPLREMDVNLVRSQLKQRRILPSGRSMQFGGDAILRKEMRGYNCSFSHCDRPRFFSEAFWLLLCGTGVGFSVQKQHVERIPVFEGVNREKEPTKWLIADTIEGWADAAEMLIGSYLLGDPAVRFDYSAIRPEGAPLSSSSGKAPGPKPLRDALEHVRGLLDKMTQNGPTKLRPIDAYDIVMHLAGAVLSGGVRRSATICLFSVDDTEMMQAKTGAWFEVNPQRSRSNNSAVLLRKDAQRAQFNALIEATKQFGEPGFFFVDDLDYGTNPCAEITLYPMLETANGKQSGWQMCNLTSVNFATCKTVADVDNAVNAAALLGTWQAGYFDTGYLGAVTKSILQRDALLGVSFTGMADNPALAFNHELQRWWAMMAKSVNKREALYLGFAPATRVTCVKPEGTQSLIVKAANGIHPHHARRYVRHVQANANEAPARYLASINPDAVSPSPYRQGDVVLAFPVESPNGAWLKKDTTALGHLGMVLETQKNWVETGTREGTAHHNVSNTILVRADEWNTVADFIWANRDHFAGVSLLPASGDLDYPAAPFVGVDDLQGQERAQVADRWASLARDWKPVDYTAMREYEDNTALVDNVACAGGACEF